METLSNFLTNHILLIFVIGIILIIWSIIIVKYVSSHPYQHLLNEFNNFKGFPLKNIPLNNNDNGELRPKAINRSENSHMLVYGQSGSGKTTFIKHYIKNIDKFIIFTLSMDDWENKENIFDLSSFPNLINNIDQINSYTIVIDDAGNNKELKELVSKLFTIGRHHNIQVIYVAHDVVDINPKSRGNIQEIYVTIANTSEFFSRLEKVFNIKINSTHYKKLFKYGLLKINLITEDISVYNSNFELVNPNLNTNLSFDPSKYITNDSYFFKGETFNKLKLFLEEESNRTINITEESIAFYFVVWCIQHNLNPNLSKVKYYFDLINSNFSLSNIIDNLNKANKIKYETRQLIN